MVRVCLPPPGHRTQAETLVVEETSGVVAVCATDLVDWRVMVRMAVSHLYHQIEEACPTNVILLLSDLEASIRA